MLPDSDDSLAGHGPGAALLALHMSLLTGHASASDDLAEILIPLVLCRLAGQFGPRDPHSLRNATHDAVLWYLSQPHKYDSHKARLDIFLTVVAQRRLIDLHRIQRRQASREITIDTDLLDNMCPEFATSPAPNVPSAENDDDFHLQRILRLAKTRAECRFIVAVFRGASDAVLAALLEISHLGVEAQRAEVRRIVKRFRARARYRRPTQPVKSCTGNE